MVEAEVLIGRLRHQVQRLQFLVDYLEDRVRIEDEEYVYSQQQLREVIERLRGLERFVSQRSHPQSLRAAWLN